MSIDLKLLRSIRAQIHRALVLHPEALRGVLDSLSVTGFADGRLQLQAPSRFARDKAVIHLAAPLLQAWQVQLPEVCAIDISVGRRPTASVSEALPSFPGWQQPNTNPPPPKETVNDWSFMGQSAAAEQNPERAFNPGEPYTFDTFLIGEANRSAAAAVQRITAKRQMPFNVLFLYGGPGLGKTHLMHAAVRHLMQHDPERRTLYLSAEQFMYRFVQALRRRDTEAFKDEFRSPDILWIDDVQFLAGKEGTQEEFFHTFNTLIDNGRLVVLSADRLPHRIDSLEDRIKSRLNGGSAIELLPPEPDLRRRILRFKARRMQHDYPVMAQLPEEIFEFLALRITGNVRELEGALHRIAARTSTGDRRLTLDSVREILADMVQARGNQVDVEDILRKTAERFSVSIEDLNGDCRNRDIATARQTAMYLLREAAGLSYPEIGKMFGGRSHTTVMHAVRKIGESLVSDPAFKRRTDDLRRYFGKL